MFIYILRLCVYACIISQSILRSFILYYVRYERMKCPVDLFALKDIPFKSVTFYIFTHCLGAS